MQGRDKEKSTGKVFQNSLKENGEKTVEQEHQNCSEIIGRVKTVGEQKFSKRQLLTSEKFSGKRDILTALLSEDRDYSVSEAESVIQNFMKGKVK